MKYSFCSNRLNPRFHVWFERKKLPSMHLPKRKTSFFSGVFVFVFLFFVCCCSNSTCDQQMPHSNVFRCLFTRYRKRNAQKITKFRYKFQKTFFSIRFSVILRFSFRSHPSVTCDVRFRIKRYETTLPMLMLNAPFVHLPLKIMLAYHIHSIDQTKQFIFFSVFNSPNRCALLHTY